MTPKQITEALREHKLWLRGKDGGKKADFGRADLRDADLRGAELQGANLRWANLRNASLEGADLQRADLTGARLHQARLQGVRLWSTIGNMAEIRSMQIDRYAVAWIMDPEGEPAIQIACQHHTLSKWDAFLDFEIEEMGRGALNWWKSNKDFVLATVRRFPAEPYGAAGYQEPAE